MERFVVITMYCSEQLYDDLSEADVVCVQNLTNTNFQKVTQHIKLQGFTEVHTAPKSMDPNRVWEGIYSKHKFTKKGYISFAKSKEGRGLTWVELSTTPQIHIVTSEFESKGEGSTSRKAQTEELAVTFGNKSIIFAGSTNIASWQKLNIDDISDKWIDAWLEGGTSSNEYTDGVDRLDRIWYTSTNTPLLENFEVLDDRVVKCSITF